MWLRVLLFWTVASIPVALAVGWLLRTLNEPGHVRLSVFDGRALMLLIFIVVALQYRRR